MTATVRAALACLALLAAAVGSVALGVAMPEHDLLWQLTGTGFAAALVLRVCWWLDARDDRPVGGEPSRGPQEGDGPREA